MLVASRDRASSVAMDVELLRASPAIKVLWMLRDPRDVLTSRHPAAPDAFYVSPGRLIQSLELYLRFKDEPQILPIRYEELVLSPAAVQAGIAEAFQIEPSRAFTECHRHFPQFYQNIRAMHSIRPLDRGGVGRWRTTAAGTAYLEKTFADHPNLISLSSRCGYDIDLGR
ncbi:MAG: sulfotransferase domain-containing protein [Planctomycetaceae bacterium]